MNSVGNLMNHPDAFGQYYHPTPTPAAMGYYTTKSPGFDSHLGGNNYNKYSHTNSPVIIGQPDTNNYDQGPWQKSNHYYGREVRI